MKKVIKEIIRHEIQILLKEDRRSEMMSKMRIEAVENGEDSLRWFISKFDHGLPNDETRAILVKFGSSRNIYYYTKHVDKGPRDDTRSAILERDSLSPWFAYLYARDIDGIPREDTRKAAYKDDEGVFGILYDRRFNITDPPPL